jgi:P-type Mg2+ transporter
MTRATLRQPSRGRAFTADDVRLRELSSVSTFTLLQQVGGSPRGLTEEQAAERLARVGENTPLRPAEDGLYGRLVIAIRSPFVALLAALGVVFAVVGNPGGAITVAAMVVAAVALRIWQQTRVVRATRALREFVTETTTVRRRADADTTPADREVVFSDVVPGDIVVLHTCDVVPADLRIITSTGLLVDESVLTGESLPASKAAVGPGDEDRCGPDESVIRTPTVCFSGSVVVGGTATGVVISTGADTYFSSLARAAGGPRPESSFDLGVRAVGWTLVRFMLTMAPIVFVVNGLVSGSWTQAAMFAAAVAVGLTPEMLPVVVTTNLARGAIGLAHDRVVVRRLDAIQDLGAMDVLCVDKTGTLTEDRIVFAHSVDVTGRLDDSVAEFARLAVHFQDDIDNRLDEAIAELLSDQCMPLVAEAAFTKVGEIGSDYLRRRGTVVVTRRHGEHIAICKGDPDHVLPLCNEVRIDGDSVDFGADIEAEARDVIDAYRAQGMQVLAVAVRDLPARLERYSESDERQLVLAGFVGFVDPIRGSAGPAVARLAEHGVAVKILSGDSRTAAVRVATQVGVDTEKIVLGRQIERLGDRRLQAVAERSSVFAELNPTHKARIVAALRDGGRVVGFLGDGVNDAAALRVADVGIATDTATEAAKQAADVILLDPDLAIIARGVVEGRRTLANTMKYVKITASSNFGNVLSVVAASAFLPFLPMLPIQLMVQNLLYDTAQLALPWDRVGSDYLRAPRRWQSGGLVRFMVTFGALSSVFDLATFAVLWWVFRVGHSPPTFQTCWFVEGLMTQLLVVLVLRARAAPWRAPRPAGVVVLAAVGVAAIGTVLPITPLAATFGMAQLPGLYAVWLVVVIVAYGLTAHRLKTWYLGHHQSWL